ncbi:MAG: hypothetical protein ACFB4I_11800 [Cyanophyceae cyanobacterium]
MRRIKRWQFLRTLGLEFWLPLPLLGFAFWGSSGLLTNRSLIFSKRSVEPFEIVPVTAQSSPRTLYIKVIVDRNRNLSQVRVKQATQIYQRQEFELATTELEQIETVISQRLGLSPEKVRRLSRYQIEN